MMNQAILWLKYLPLLLCITFGETIDEAMDMAYEAIEAVLESRKANRYEIMDNQIEIQNSRKPIEMFMPMACYSKRVLVCTKGIYYKILKQCGLG